MAKWCFSELKWGNIQIMRTTHGAHALDRVLPIRVGGTQKRDSDMIETTVDYWTCLELAQALEQTMRNDLWSTADRIAETASRITSKPEELVAALQQYEIKKAAMKAANSLSDSSIITRSSDSTSFSKAG